MCSLCGVAYVSGLWTLEFWSCSTSYRHVLGGGNWCDFRLFDSNHRRTSVCQLDCNYAIFARYYVTGLCVPLMCGPNPRSPPSLRSGYVCALDSAGDWSRLRSAYFPSGWADSCGCSRGSFASGRRCLRYHALQHRCLVVSTLSLTVQVVCPTRASATRPSSYQTLQP